MTAPPLPPEFDGLVRRDEPLARHAALGVGGPADLFFEPADEASLVAFVAALGGALPILWMGTGSRLLVRDGGWRGAAITTRRALLRLDRTADDEVVCGAGVACGRLAEQCLAWGLGPGAFFGALPGSLGGALELNAGALGGEVWRHVITVLTLDRFGNRHEHPARDFEVGYRFVVGPPGEGFLGARLRIAPGAADARAGRALASGEPPGVAVFTDPPGRRAARLINDAGLAGARVDSAELAVEPPNTLALAPTTLAADIERLLGHVRENVRLVHGVALAAELRVVGEPPGTARSPRPAPGSPAERSAQSRGRPVGPVEGGETQRTLAALHLTEYRPATAPVADPGPTHRGAYLCSRQLGCPANLALATQLHNYLTANGWALSDAEAADCIVLVACIILVDYRRDVQQAVDFLARRFPAKRIYVTGCFAPEDRITAPNVVFIGMLQKHEFDRWFEPTVLLRDVSPVSTDSADRELVTLSRRAAYDRPCNVLVATGCLRHCHYCVEPLLFPSVTSVPLDEVVSACREGLRKGYSNVLIGAADIASYGYDLGLDVTDLFRALFSDVFASRPDVGVGFKALEPAGFLRHFDALRPFFASHRIDWIYLPLESGSDRVLRSMNRRYRVDEVLAVVRELREIAPALRIETDFVIAYPTETPDDFAASLALLEHFDNRNLVPFERQPGTRAFALPDGFDAAERARRLDVAKTIALRQARIWRFYFAGEADERSSDPMAEVPVPLPPRSVYLYNREPGCPINQSLTNRFSNYARANGWPLVEEPEAAEAVVIVSCSSLPTMRQGVVSLVRDLACRMPSTPVVVTCCFMPDDTVDVPNVRYVPLSRSELFDDVFHPRVHFRDVPSGATPETDREVQALQAAHDADSVFNRQYTVMVAVGCLNRCSFCSGKSMFPTVQSVPTADIVAECLTGVRKGYTHLVLGASDIASYGHDLGCDVTDLFAALFSEVLKERPHLGIGLKGLEPSGFLRYYDRLKPYFASGRITWIDMPIQSGSDRVLRSMNRRYRVADVLRVVGELRQLVPGIRINTDVIFCYPTETDEDFAASMTVFDHFDNVQMLAFQRHPETPSYALADVFDAAEGERRHRVVAEALKTRSQLFQGVWTKPPEPPPQTEAPPAPIEAEPGHLRIRFASAARADVTFDFTVALVRLDAHFCRTVGPYVVETGVDTPARGALPLLRVLGATMRRLAAHPPSGQSHARWSATLDELLARTDLDHLYRCTVTFVPHANRPPEPRG